MTGPANIDSWFEFIVWMAIAIGALVTSVAAIKGARHAREGRNETRAVRDQVQNDHTSNLREDLDRVDEKVDQVDTKVDRLTGRVDELLRGFEIFAREQRHAPAKQAAIAAKQHPEDMRSDFTGRSPDRGVRP